MTFDLERIWASKRAFRRQIAACSVGEKLRLLDGMRERELAIRASRMHSEGARLQEPTVPYRAGQGEVSHEPEQAKGDGHRA